ncbi:hypothetical protein D9756_008489 [Leucocoprinus leucothites]|uniref:Uncharacterized protein n=1 Tax=Leucocoprinus leucothites TaxID=201217 RepID=A0A8H5D1X1_9AGAR|nr:hypothetical protein D9756_008489 [Leucoagaricus leucothites]
MRTPRKAATTSKLDSSPERPLVTNKRKRPSSTNQSTPTVQKTRTRRKEDEESEELDSDALDEESDDDDNRRKKKKPKTPRRKPTSTPKRKSRKSTREESDEDEDGEELELDEGQEIVGRVVKAPTTGLVPPGQISRNTLNFLNKLKDPECNDRQWFKLHEPVYRVAEKEWKDFIDSFTDVLIQVDPEIPPLPPKDVIHRIYRDIRFSNDKTPYKKGLSASFSRSGRKGIFAGYHVAIKPGNESMIAAGSWCPSRNELSTIRANIQRDPTRLRQIISSPEFEKYFGEAKPHPKGERRNIYGMEDELKTAPKGVDKTHKDIDLLKCRSFAVTYRFTDSEVLDPDFKHKIGSVAKIVQPFVHCLNDMMTVTADDEDDSGGDEQGDEEDEE